MKQNSARSRTQFVVVALIDDIFAFKRGERERVGEMGAPRERPMLMTCQPRDLATGLQMAIADLSSRYVLGFSLDDRDYGMVGCAVSRSRLRCLRREWPAAKSSSSGAQAL